jgi:hypothetical protein
LEVFAFNLLLYPLFGIFLRKQQDKKGIAEALQAI